MLDGPQPVSVRTPAFHWKHPETKADSDFAAGLLFPAPATCIWTRTCLARISCQRFTGTPPTSEPGLCEAGLRRAGADKDCFRVVVYDDWSRALCRRGLWWLLRWLGPSRRSKVLRRGSAGLEAAKTALSQGKTTRGPVAEGNFTGTRPIPTTSRKQRTLSPPRRPKLANYWGRPRATGTLQW